MSHRKSDLGIPCLRKICQSSARACTHINEQIGGPLSGGSPHNLPSKPFDLGASFSSRATKRPQLRAFLRTFAPGARALLQLVYAAWRATRQALWICRRCHRQLRRPKFPRADHRGVGGVTPPVGLLAARHAAQARGEAGLRIPESFLLRADEVIE